MALGTSESPCYRRTARARVRNPIWHGSGESASPLNESHATHVGAVSLNESQPEISPSESQAGGTPVHITTRPYKKCMYM